jgi:hypothetical protein
VFDDRLARSEPFYTQSSGWVMKQMVAVFICNPSVIPHEAHLSLPIIHMYSHSWPIRRFE